MHPIAELDLAHASTLIEKIHLPMKVKVLVFRTSVSDERRADRLRPVLERLVGRVGRWSFDLEDRDRVLRIESSCASHVAVIAALRDVGEDCSELD